MVKTENHLGVITITNEYFTNLVGYIATSCFGVTGMAVSGKRQGLRSLFSKEEYMNKGVRVSYLDKKLYIDINILVTYGVNISEIVKSIVQKVKYAVETATGLEVECVNVKVAGMKSE